MDRDAVRRTVSAHPVCRLRLPALRSRIDSIRSLVTLICWSISQAASRIRLSRTLPSGDLEAPVQVEPVDLVMTEAIRNPLFLSAVEQQAEEI